MKRAIVFTTTLLFLSLNAYAQDDPDSPMGDPTSPAGDPATSATPAGDPGYSPAATVAPIPAQPRGTTTLGLLLGPKFGVVDAVGTLFTVGAEFATKSFQLPVLFGFGGGQDIQIELIPKFKYDIEVIPNLLITPSAGLDLTMGFGGATSLTVGVEIAARATYYVTPQIGIFFEPLALDMNFVSVVVDVGTSGGFSMFYRMLAGAVYAF